MKRASTEPTKTRKAYKACCETYAEMKRKSAEGKGEDMIKEILAQFKKARKYQFNKLAAEFSAYLQYHFFNFKDDKKLGNIYSDMALHYNELAYIENIVWIKFSKICYELNQTRNPDEKLVKHLKNTCEDLKPYLKYESAQIWIYTYTLLNELANIEGKYHLAIDQSKDVIKYLENRKIERTALFYKDITTAFIQEGKYREALDAIEKSKSLLNMGSLTWSISAYYRIVIELHRRNYQQAYELLQEARKKKYINKAMEEQWYITRGYMQFLIEVGKVVGESKFKIGRFLNSVEVSSKDKPGQNTNVIILNTILNIQSNRDSIIESQKASQQYAYRNLDKDSRAKIFFQMLHQIVPGNFQKDKVQARAQKYLNLLPPQKGYNPDLEIIPFEDLWEMVLGTMG